MESCGNLNCSDGAERTCNADCCDRFGTGTARTERAESGMYQSPKLEVLRGVRGFALLKRD